MISIESPHRVPTAVAPVAGGLPNRLALRWAVIIALELLNDRHHPPREVRSGALARWLQRAAAGTNTNPDPAGYPTVLAVNAARLAVNTACAHLHAHEFDDAYHILITARNQLR